MSAGQDAPVGGPAQAGRNLPLAAAEM